MEIRADFMCFSSSISSFEIFKNLCLSNSFTLLLLIGCLSKHCFKKSLQSWLHSSLNFGLTASLLVQFFSIFTTCYSDMFGYGYSPVSISISKWPMPQTSVTAPTNGALKRISGGVYLSEPIRGKITVLKFFTGSSTYFRKPKSESFTTPSSSTNKLLALMSQ